jgi:predicted RNA-binding protein YlxR (DUF448 family)
MGQANQKAKGTRPKHIPQRTCISCRRTDAKRGLIRVVREADGHVGLDPSGKRAGRGAYLCHNPECWNLALRRHGLERALRIDTIMPEDRTVLEALVHDLTTSQTEVAE